jgi:hypothetical protein
MDDPEPDAPDEALSSVGPTYITLSDEEATDVIDHINRKAVAKDDGCQVCGSPQNSVTVNVYRVDASTKPTAIVGGTYQPLYSTVCYNCGFVRFFNQNVVRGIIAREKPAEGGADGS